MNLKNKSNNRKGFTLVELLLVIVIIVILGVLLIPNVLETLNESRVENGKSIEKLLIKNLELYNTDHAKDLWNNNNDDYDCNNTITYEELLQFNPDIDLGECLLNNENSFTIEKVGANRYKYYVGITCGKKLTKNPGNPYIIDKDKEQDSYYTTENPQCNGSIVVTANPNKAKIAEPLLDGWVKNGDKVQKQMTPGEEFGTLPSIENIENSGYICAGWNTDKDGAGESISGDTKAQFAIRTIYAKCTTTGGDVGRLSFENQTIERNYSTRPITISLPNDITNGIGPYKYTEKSETYKKNDESTNNENTSNISISGYTIVIDAGSPIGIYTCEIEVEDLNTKQKATAIYTIRVNRVITYLDVPTSPASKIYTGEEQESGIKCPDGSETRGTTKATRVGDYNQICHIIDPEFIRWNDASHSATDKTINWKITNAECPKPSNINISTAGVVTWTGSEKASSYQINTGGNWQVASSGQSQLNKILNNIDNTQNTVNKTISVRAICDNENYNRESSAATQAVALNKITFNSSDTSKGTVNENYYYAIQGSEYETNTNKFLVKGSGTGDSKVTVKTITAEPKSTHHTFSSWSKTSGTINSPETITANFGIKQYTVNVNVLQGVIHDDVAIKTVDYNTSPTFKLKASEEGAAGIVSCGSDQHGTIENTTVSGEEVSILTINNISADTTCTVTFATTQTVLHEDGTLIINEKASDRPANITRYGQIMQKTVGETTYDLVYQKIGDGYNYIFNSFDEQLWKNERSLIKKVKLGEPISGSTNTGYWFYGLNNLEEADLTNLDTSQVTSMAYMFLNAGSDLNNSKEFKIIGLSNWNTSSVTNMASMFYQVGFNAGSINIGNISNWNTSNVTNMASMFLGAGYKARTFGLDLSSGTGWNTSNVTDMSYMFSQTGFDSDYFELNLTPDTDSWNTSNVTTMEGMFMQAGYAAMTWTIGDISVWNTSNVTKMGFMFNQANGNTMEGSHTADVWKLGEIGIGGWDTSKVTEMNGMFAQAGIGATTWFIGDLSNWNTSKVTNMTSMFNQAGFKATTFDIGDISNWNVSKVTNMSSMFLQAGHTTQGKFNLGNLGKWNLAEVTSMADMFNEAGYNAQREWYIGDLSTWVAPKLTGVARMFRCAGYSAPTFDLVNLSNLNLTKVKSTAEEMFNQAGFSATTWRIGDISSWNVSNVTSMANMFYKAGYNATTWNIGNLSSWNISNVTQTTGMFDQAGYKANSFALDLSSWNTIKVINMANMFHDSGHNANAWTIGDISSWDVSKVTDMNNMFDGIGHNATTITLNLSSWNTANVTNMTNMFADVGSGSSRTILNIGSLDIHARDITGICANTNVNGTLNIYNNPTTYTGAFSETSKLTGTLVTVNYSASTTNIDNIINTKTIGSNVVKASSPTLTN